MTHWLQTLWWEWKLRRIKSARALILGTLPFEPSLWGRDMLIREARRIEREMDELRARISARVK